MIGSTLVEVARTTRGLCLAGVEVSDAMGAASVAHNDPRWASAIERRRESISAQLHAAPVTLLRRAHGEGIPLDEPDLPELLARVETVRGLAARRALDAAERGTFERSAALMARVDDRRELLAGLDPAELYGRALAEHIDPRAERAAIIEALARHTVAQEMTIEAMGGCA